MLKLRSQRLKPLYVNQYYLITMQDILTLIDEYLLLLKRILEVDKQINEKISDFFRYRDIYK